MPRKVKEKAKVYFPGLHGLRFFAAMLVVFSHIELMKDYHGYPNLYASNLAVYESGRMGVTLFFVLSGFLISYLLLTEQKVSGTISVRKFYSRRILRIWPLYYLLVLTTFVVLPRIAFFAVPEYIINVAANPHPLIRIENRLFIFLGNISFSIYMFHEIVIKATMQSLGKMWGVNFNDAASTVTLYTLSIAGTLTISAIAYYGFEKRFLRLKSSYAVVESGQDLIEKGAPLVPTKSVA